MIIPIDHLRLWILEKIDLGTYIPKPIPITCTELIDLYVD